MWIRSPATCARSGETAANATAPGKSKPPWKGGASPRPGDASAASCANRACGRVRAQTVQTAQHAGRRGQAREPAGPRVRRLRPAHASGGRSYLCPRRRRLGVRVPAGRPGGQGNRRPFRRPFRRTAPGRRPDAGRVRRPRLPADGRPGVPHRPGQRVRQHEDRRAADVFDIKGSLPRRGSSYGNAVVESTDRLLRKELVYRNHYTTAGQPRRGPDCCVWWSDNQRLHSTLGYRSPKEFAEQGLVL